MSILKTKISWVIAGLVSLALAGGLAFVLAARQAVTAAPPVATERLRAAADRRAVNRTDQLIVSALVEVCAGLGIKTVAEFVGDQATMDIVRELGVDFAQGYHLGRPQPVSSLRAATAG